MTKKEKRACLRGRVDALEYPDNYQIMKNSFVLYKIESLTDKTQDGVLAAINNSKRHYRPEPTPAPSFAPSVVPSAATPVAESGSVNGSAAPFACFC